MWSAEKTTSLAKQAFDPLPLELIEAIHALWVGGGTDEDERIAAEGLARLHDDQKWIACDCRSDEGVFPLMAPAYLRAFGTFYLRRLYGKTRPSHAASCPFHGEPWLGDDRVIEHQSMTCPDGYFEIEDARPEDLSGLDRASFQDGRRPPRLYTDRLRLQLWRLMERARLNEIAPPVPTIKPSYVHEYAKLKDAAERLHVSQASPLSLVFETAPQAIARKSIYARVRQLMKSDPSAAGQGFVAFMAKDVDTKQIRMRAGVIAPMAGVDVISGGAPYLVLVLIGLDEKGGLCPLKASAQPILSGRRFFPVFSNAEREWIEGMISEQYRLRRTHPQVAAGLRRPLFTEDGSKPLGTHVVNLDTGAQQSNIVVAGTSSQGVYGI